MTCTGDRYSLGKAIGLLLYRSMAILVNSMSLQGCHSTPIGQLHVFPSVSIDKYSSIQYVCKYASYRTRLTLLFFFASVSIRIPHENRFVRVYITISETSGRSQKVLRRYYLHCGIYVGKSSVHCHGWKSRVLTYPDGRSWSVLGVDDVADRSPRRVPERWYVVAVVTADEAQKTSSLDVGFGRI